MLSDAGGLNGQGLGLLYCILQPGWCASARERDREKERERDEKQKTRQPVYMCEKFSCDQWHWGLETFVTLAGILNYTGHKLSPPLKPHGVVDAHKSRAWQLYCNSVRALPGSPTQCVQFHFTSKDNSEQLELWLLIYLSTVVRTLIWWSLKIATESMIPLISPTVFLCLENPKWLPPPLFLSQCHQRAQHCNAELLSSYTVCRKWLTVKDQRQWTG